MILAPSPDAALDLADTPETHLRECPDCGLLLRQPPAGRKTVSRCPRCRAVLRRSRVNPIARAFALTATGMVLFVIATQLDFVRLSVGGRLLDTSVVSGPEQLEQNGMWEVGLVVLVTTLAAPLARLCCLLWVFLGLHVKDPPQGLHVAYRWSEKLAPWSMVEVFLLGVFVAYTKLRDIAHVEIGGAVYALAALMLAQIAADAALDPEVVWRRLQAIGSIARPRFEERQGREPRGPLIGCHTCSLVSDEPDHCPRCGARKHRRKPNATVRCLALLTAAAVLYLPANMLPVMTYIRLGRGTPNTILSGVMELAASGMWPLAALVFFASITVPVLKLVGLTYLLVTTRMRSRRRMRTRALIYRIVDSIGRWSMIDVFMISILTALVRMGALASVYPQAGVIAFCSVVVLTMLAAMSFDPRLMWDAGGFNPPPPVDPRTNS